MFCYMILLVFTNFYNDNLQQKCEYLLFRNHEIKVTESEFNEFEPRLKCAKNQFQLSAGLNFETFNTILSETHHT